MTKTGRRNSLDDKIAKAEAKVIKLKESYDRALDELNRLVSKKKELEGKELMRAYEKSERSLEEVIEFLKGGDDSEGDG